MATKYYSSDTPFLNAYFVVEDDGVNEFQVSKYFSHVGMAAAFIEDVQKEHPEVEMFISCILDNEMLQCALHSLKEGGRECLMLVISQFLLNAKTTRFDWIHRC